MLYKGAEITKNCLYKIHFFTMKKFGGKKFSTKKYFSCTMDLTWSHLKLEVERFRGRVSLFFFRSWPTVKFSILTFPIIISLIQYPFTMASKFPFSMFQFHFLFCSACIPIKNKYHTF